MKCFRSEKSLKNLSLAVIFFQATIWLVVVKYSRRKSAASKYSKQVEEEAAEDLYLVTTVVFLSESLKLFINLIFFCFSHGFQRCQIELKNNVFEDSWDTWQLIIPAVLYYFQNSVAYFALTYIDILTYQITSQARIIFTAVCSHFILNKNLTLLHWCSLLFLTLGVALVQIDTFLPTVEAELKYKTGNENNSKFIIGIVSVLACGLTSSFNGVFFEKIVKKSPKTNLTVRNIQLGTFSLIISILGICNDSQNIFNGGFFQGYNWLTWVAIAMQAISGIIISVAMKYADSILRQFAQALSLILSTLVTVMLLGERSPTPLLIIGTGLVISASIGYSRAPNTEKFSVDLHGGRIKI